MFFESIDITVPATSELDDEVTVIAAPELFVELFELLLPAFPPAEPPALLTPPEIFPPKPPPPKPPPPKPPPFLNEFLNDAKFAALFALLECLL